MFKLKQKNMQINYPANYPLYDPSYGNDYPTEQLYINYFNILPSKFLNSLTYNEDIVLFFQEIGFINLSKIITQERKYDRSAQIVQKLFIHEKKQMLIRTITDGDKNDNLKFEILYNIQLGEINTIIDFNKIQLFEVQKKKSNVNLIKSTMGHLDVQEYDLNVPKIDLKLNYGENFLKINDVIVDRLNRDNDKGIVLLHGEPGTGKTSYIKYLTSVIKKKEILFVPPSMVEILSDPSIIPFLMDYKNSILIIEDAERVISDRDFNGNSTGVSNILNLTDGILSDCLGIQIIATFNMKREKIDNALLRKGRLIAEHKFDKLNHEETNNLLKYLNKDIVADEGMTLADIYNIETELYKTKSQTNKIGFHGNN